MKAKEVMEILGICRQTLCNYVKQGKIKIDAVINGTQNKYIDKKDLDMFISQGFKRGRINKKVNLC